MNVRRCGWLLVLTSVGAVACSGSTEKTGPVASTPLGGTVYGQNFVFASANTGRGELPADVFIFDRAENSCASWLNDGRKISVYGIPWKAGTTVPLSESSRSGTYVTFVDEKNGSESHSVPARGQ